MHWYSPNLDMYCIFYHAITLHNLLIQFPHSKGSKTSKAYNAVSIHCQRLRLQDIPQFCMLSGMRHKKIKNKISCTFTMHLQHSKTEIPGNYRHYCDLFLPLILIVFTPNFVWYLVWCYCWEETHWYCFIIYSNPFYFSVRNLHWHYSAHVPSQMLFYWFLPNVMT